MFDGIDLYWIDILYKNFVMYRLASRDNINSDTFDMWPAVQDKNFTKYNNKIEPHIFNTEDSILNWLDSKCRTNIADRTMTNVHEFRNGNPNKIYSVYLCNHTNNEHPNGYNNMHDKFLYSVRVKKSTEAFMTYA